MSLHQIGTTTFDVVRAFDVVFMSSHQIWATIYDACGHEHKLEPWAMVLSALCFIPSFCPPLSWITMPVIKYKACSYFILH